MSSLAYTLCLTADHENDFVGEMEPLYLSDGTSLTTVKWNNEHRQILRDALTQHLYPLFANEVRHKLKEEAEERVIEASTNILHSMLMRRPYMRRKEDVLRSPSFRHEESDRHRMVFSFVYLGLCIHSILMPIHRHQNESRECSGNCL
jgi:transcriptional accessory protein Tex/SPT6